MWSPTHVQVTVLRARNLIGKGKGGTNNAFVTIQLGKDKFQTSVVENIADPEWEEECDLVFKDQEGSIVLNVFHRNFFGLDEFLGQVLLPLSDYGIYDSPKTDWFFLKNKPGKKDDRDRGELEVRIAFMVRDTSSNDRLTELQDSKKSLSGSLLDVASAVGHKIQKLPTRSLSLKLDRLDSRLKLDRFKTRRASPAEDAGSTLSFGSTGSSDHHTGDGKEDTPKTLRHRSMSLSRLHESRQSWNKDYDSAFADDDLPAITESPAKNLNEICPKSKRQRSNSSSFSKLSNLVENSMKRTISVPGSTEMSLSSVSKGIPHSASYDNWNEYCNKPQTPSDEMFSPLEERPVPRERKSRLRRLRSTGRRHTIQEVELPDSLLEESYNTMHQTKIDNNNINNRTTNLIEKFPRKIVEQYETMNHRELLGIVLSQQELLQMQEDKIRDLELYIDNLLVRVMETQPRILQNPYKTPNPAMFR